MCEKTRITEVTGVQNKPCIFLIMLALLLSTVTIYGYDIDSSDRVPSDKPDKTGNGSPSLNAARADVISEDFSKAVSEYAILLRQDSANVSLNAEYAYALALSGIYDAALARLDRIWIPNSNSADVNFFTSQVFALMGYDLLAIEFVKEIEAGSIPAWISSAAPEFLLKYKERLQGVNMSEDGDVVTDFKRANRLTAQNHNLMSMALFEEIISGYPGEYLPYVGYSIALEKAGMFEKSAQALEQALAIISVNTEQQEAKQMVENRLAEVRGKSAAEGKKSNANLLNAVKPDEKGRRMLAYAGGMFSSSYISLTGRIGTYISGAGSLSADLGVTRSGGATSLNVGVMNFFHQKIFAGGYGLNVGFGGGSTALNFKISVGLSIMNKGNDASWDIFIDGQQPIAPKGSATTMGMSIGRSVYFGSR